MATTYLSTNLPANQNSLHKWTYSGWIKRCDLGAEIYMFNFYDDDNNRGGLRFNSDDTLLYYERVGGSTVINKTTNRKFRDTSAWYHVMVAVDKSVSSPDTQIYINGVEETSFSTDTDYTQNQSTKINDTDNLYINSYNGSSDIKSQIQSHVHWVSGYKLTPATFGETDSTTGEWKINTSPSVTYGTNGFFILKDGNSVTDQSGNSNNFTVAGGTLTNTEDCPSNVFATMNPLDNYYFGGTFTNGNTTVQSGSSSYSYCSSTIHVSSGKWYWEIKADTPGSAMRVGIGSKLATSTSDNLGNDTDGEAAIYPDGNLKVDNVDNPNSWSGTSWTTGDILGFALDLDNSKLYISKNGTFMNSGNPASGTNGITLTAAASTPTGAYFVAWGDNWSAGTATMSHNFGNGYFGTTAISSEGTNASGIGKFEYDVPTGYTALSTKGLNE